MTKRIVCKSIGRYNGGTKAKRAFGSSTITTFAVWIEGDPSTREDFDVGGKTPSARKAEAIRRFNALILSKIFES
jgi:hypothetical protein